jgi:hypothetical protein
MTRLLAISICAVTLTACAGSAQSGREDDGTTSSSTKIATVPPTLTAPRTAAETKCAAAFDDYAAQVLAHSKSNKRLDEHPLQRRTIEDCPNPETWLAIAEQHRGSATDLFPPFPADLDELLRQYCRGWDTEPACPANEERPRPQASSS